MRTVPETDGASEVTPQTRAARRAARAAGRHALAPRTGVGSPEVGAVRRPLVTTATVALCALLALSGFAGAQLVAAAVGLAGLVLAWGWPALMGSPSRVGSSTVLALGTLACVLAVAFTTSDPFLRYLPLALACSLIAVFVHQLLRRDGRPRLTESVAVTAAGLALISSGACLVALPRTYDGGVPVAAASAAIALASLADLAAGWPRLRPWMLPTALLLGGIASAAVFQVGGPHRLAPAFLIGLLGAGVSHATRRVLSVLPPIATARSQLVASAASVLVPGVVAYLLVRVLMT